MGDVYVDVYDAMTYDELRKFIGEICALGHGDESVLIDVWSDDGELIHHHFISDERIASRFLEDQFVEGEDEAHLSSMSIDMLGVPLETYDAETTSCHICDTKLDSDGDCWVCIEGEKYGAAEDDEKSVGNPKRLGKEVDWIPHEDNYLPTQHDKMHAEYSRGYSYERPLFMKVIGVAAVAALGLGLMGMGTPVTNE